MIQRYFFICLTLFIVVSTGALAADENSLSYPELQVTPRASERLKIENENEPSQRWKTHLPIQISATATLVTGLTSIGKYKEEKDTTPSSAAIGVGASWLAITTYLAATYTPYQDGWAKVSRKPTGTERERLTRERLAEESLDEPAGLAWKLQWLSFATNAAANIYVLGAMSDKDRLASMIGTALAFAPILFRYHWSEVSKTHELYKKKIYGPVAFATVFSVPGTHEITPGLAWAYHF